MRRWLIIALLVWLGPALAEGQIISGGVTVIPDTGASNNFLTAISSGGVISKAQPSFSNLSGIATPGQLSGTVNAQTGTTYTVLDGDRGKLVTHSNAAAIAVTLPQAGAGGAFISGWFYGTENRGAGTVTITPTTSTIDGAASLALTTNQGVSVHSDGTNYFTQRGVGGGGGTDRYVMVIGAGPPNNASLTNTSSTWHFRSDVLNFGGAGEVPTNFRGSMVVPIASTLLAVYYKISITGAQGTAGELFTHKTSKNEAAATSGATTAYNGVEFTVSETGLSVSFAAGDRIGAYLLSPSTLTTFPTGVSGTATFLFTVP